MIKDFKEFVCNGCMTALSSNSAYMEMERNPKTDQDLLAAKAEELCFIQGFKDALRLCSIAIENSGIGTHYEQMINNILEQYKVSN